MKRITRSAVTPHLPFFQAAAKIALEATCYQARCGAIIVKDDIILASGYNGPPLGLESNRTCGKDYDHTPKPKYDKTCCIHAEWRAILNACKSHGKALAGSTLYFMRIDEDGQFTDAGEPYCTVCSRLAVESGIAYFALWNQAGIDLYTTVEYDQASYRFHTPQ